MSIPGKIFEDWQNIVGKTMGGAFTFWLNCIIFSGSTASFSPEGLAAFSGIVLGGSLILSHLIFACKVIAKLWNGEYSNTHTTHYNAFSHTNSHQYTHTQQSRPSVRPHTNNFGFFNINDLGMYRTNREVPSQSVSMQQLNKRYENALGKLSPEDKTTCEKEAEDRGYNCALMMDLMSEPCRAGNTNYWIEKRYLIENITRFKKNPMDRTPMSLADVKIDTVKQKAIATFVKRVEDKAANHEKKGPHSIAQRYEAALLLLPKDEQDNYEQIAFNHDYRSLISFEIMSEPCKSGQANNWIQQSELKDYVCKSKINPANRNPMSLKDIKIDKVKQKEIATFVRQVELAAKTYETGSLTTPARRIACTA